MITELESGVLIRITANETTVFCNCVVNNKVFLEIIEILNEYEHSVLEASIYIPLRFVKYTSTVLNLELVGEYPKYINNVIETGGYIYKVTNNE